MNFSKRSALLCAFSALVLTCLFLLDGKTAHGASMTLTLDAYSADGTNTGTARLGRNVAVIPRISGTTNKTVYWSLSGAGSLTSSGTYTAPQTMPSNNAVTITARLAANTAVTATYRLSILNPVPGIRIAYPASLATATTQTVQVWGNSFVPGSVILMNGAVVSTKYISANELTTSVAVPDAAKGSYSFAVKSPTPGGGTTSTLWVPVAVKSVSVNAYNDEGVDTHTARLGLSTQFALTVVGPGSTATNWSVQGGGWISSTGRYTAPSTMPSSSTVVVTGSLATNSEAKATYTINLLNPLPTIGQSSPSHLTAGQSNTIYLIGSGFVPGSKIYVNGSAVSATYNSPSSMEIHITPQSGATGISVKAQNAAPGGGGSGALWIPVSSGAAVVATVNTTPGRWIPQNFLGLSHEWSDAEFIMGASNGGINPIYRQLLKNLMLGQQYPFFIRIGGGSTDESGEPTSTTIPAFAELAKDMGVHFSLGVNLGKDNVQLAMDQAKAFVSQMPAGSIDGLEIGNEPDVYMNNGYRSSSYSLTDFQNDFSKWRQNIVPLVGSTKLMGPAWANQVSLPRALSGFESSESSSVGVVSQHYYGGHQYSGSIAQDYLLTSTASDAGAAGVAPYTAVAHNNGQKFRIGEMNSIDQGGLTGISDTFSSALWAIDTMFEFVKAGADGVNIHDAGDCTYCAFIFGRANVGPSRIYTLDSVRPIYYGMLFFQQATLHGTRLLPTSIKTSANVKVWATIDQNNTVRVAIINKDKSYSGDVDISLPGYGTGQVLRLVAPSYQSKDGISLGGQTFDGSIDGTPVGTQTTHSVSPSNGVYGIAVRPCTAVLVTITK